MNNDTLQPGDTMQPGDTLQLGDTLIHGSSFQAVINAPTMSGTTLPIRQTIIINGKSCFIESLIKSSGEAMVYKIIIDQLPFVFKYYKPNRQLSDTARDILKILRDKPHARIVKIIDFGKYNNQDYEIMEFAAGGTLTEFLTKNHGIRDIKLLKSIVKMINEGLLQIHNKYNFIYQDLKPDNIFFRDAKMTQLILADFGISSMMEKKDKRAQVVASLTDLYGALELSPKTGHKYVIATPAVDYYSLGITMIEMWLGEKPFKNIPPIERDYLISEEKIDFPNDMPDDYKTLIQGLLEPNRSERWGDKHIQLWLNGQPLQVVAKNNVDYITEMFTETESFSNPKQLADLMVKYPDEGTKYLFGGYAEDWFKKSGRALRADDLKEVVQTYKKSQKQGYYTAVYKIDPTRPWKSQGGKQCLNLDEIAEALMNESAFYMEDLQKPASRLYLYLMAVEGAQGVEVVEIFQKFFTEYNPQKALALICLKLQGNNLSLGGKRYIAPEEITKETDNSQMSLIKNELEIDDSPLLVWLSSFYKDNITSGKFSQQTLPSRLFILGILPFLKYKDLIQADWNNYADKDLAQLIKSSPGRADLFESYASQGLPLNKPLPNENKLPLDYVVVNFQQLKKQHSEVAVFNLIRLFVKLGADINGVSPDGNSALITATTPENKNQNKRLIQTDNKNLMKLLVELGADIEKAFKDALEKYKNLHSTYSNWDERRATEEALISFVEGGAKPGDTLFFLAKNNLSCSSLIRTLVKYGAEKRKKDFTGKTAYDYVDKRQPGAYYFRPASSIAVLRFIDETIENTIEYSNKPASYTIISIVSIGITLGLWAVLGRVFELGLLWNIIVCVIMLVGCWFGFFVFAITDRYVARPINFLVFLALCGLGIWGFISIPKLPKPVPPEILLMDITAQSAVVDKSKLSLKRTPKFTGKTVKDLQVGDILNIKSEPTAKGWLAVEHNGTTGYVYGNYVKYSLNTTTDSVYVLVAKVNDPAEVVKLKEKPSGTAKTLKKLTADDIMTVTNVREKKWLPVEHKGIMGYVKVKNVEIFKTEIQSPIEEVTPAPVVDVAPTKVINTTPAPIVEDTQPQAQEAKIQYAIVKRRRLHMTGKPGTFQKTIKVLTKNDVVIVKGEPNWWGWLPVEHEGTSGFTLKGNLTFQDENFVPATKQAKINSTVRFRSEPSTNAAIIRQLTQGETVYITGETKPDWTQVKHNGTIGWVRNEYLTK